MNKNRALNLVKKPNRFPDIPHCAGIYMIKDNVTGLAYVGSSIDVNKRLCSHLTLKGSEHHLSGLNYNECEYTLLENCKYLSKKQRLQLEYDHIIKHNTIWPNGLNKASPLTNIRFDIAKILGGKRKKDKSIKPTDNYGKKPKQFFNVLSKYGD